MKSLSSVVNAVLDKLGKICEAFCSVMAMAMILLVTVQVILRALNMPLFGVEELLNFPTIWIYFIGGVCAAYTDAHIECGIIKAVSKNKHSVMVAELVSCVLASGIGLYVLTWAWEYTKYCFSSGAKSPILAIPMIVGQIIIFIGLLLMALYTIVKTIKKIDTFKTEWEKGGEQ